MSLCIIESCNVRSITTYLGHRFLEQDSTGGKDVFFSYFDTSQGIPCPCSPFLAAFMAWAEMNLDALPVVQTRYFPNKLASVIHLVVVGQFIDFHYGLNENDHVVDEAIQ